MDNIFKRLVSYFGTQQIAASRLGVDQSTVSGWVRGKHGMSPIHAQRAEAESSCEFRKEDLCPAFPWSSISPATDASISRLHGAHETADPSVQASSTQAGAV